VINAVNSITDVASFARWATASSVCWWHRVGICHATISRNSRPCARHTWPADQHAGWSDGQNVWGNSDWLVHVCHWRYTRHSQAWSQVKRHQLFITSPLTV